MAIDPVCAMTVNESAAPARIVYNGVTYYFCSQKCLHDFEVQPDGFVRALTLIEPPRADTGLPASALRRWWDSLCAGWRRTPGAGPR